MPDKRSIPRVCVICGRDFLAYPSQIARGHGQTCSNRCGGIRRRLVNAETYAERFWAKVDKNGPMPPFAPELGCCWIWTSHRHPQGYGRTSYHGRLRLAHVIAYILTTGDEPPPETPNVIHLCHNGHLACVRPSHLKADTQATNMQQAYQVGRSMPRRGEQAPNVTLTDARVIAMRQRFAASGLTYAQLGREAGVSTQLARAVVLRIIWRHLP